MERKNEIPKAANPDDYLDQFKAFVEIVRILRRDCPWDGKQTNESIAQLLIEETYETLDAIKKHDDEEFCGELGDLLLHIVMHAAMAEERGAFNLTDVLKKIQSKLVYRHPHVFGGRKAKDVVEVEQNWEALKQEEKTEGESILSGMSEQMPALTYSQSMQRRVAGVGFDWEEVEEIIDKLAEEVMEIKHARDQLEKAREFGDLLFTLANIARRLDIDLEMALRAANQRFYRRFTHMEELCRQRGFNLADLSLEQQNALWEEAKKKVG